MLFTPAIILCAYTPGAADLISPEEGALVTSREVTFRWTPVEDAASYVLCLFHNGYYQEECGGEVLIGSGEGILVDDAATGQITIDIDLSIAPRGEYTTMGWTVAACDADLNCVWQENTQALSVDRS